jgi:hypothetical protein
MRVPRVAAKPSVELQARKRGPESLGWRRKPERDEPGRQAWVLPDGLILLLDPTGRQDTLIRQS